MFQIGRSGPPSSSYYLLIGYPSTRDFLCAYHLYIPYHLAKFCSEDGGGFFLRNVGTHQSATRSHNPEDQNVKQMSV